MLVKISELEGKQFTTSLTHRRGLVMPQTNQDAPGGANAPRFGVRVGLYPLKGRAGQPERGLGHPDETSADIFPEEVWLHPDVLVVPGWETA